MSFSSAQRLARASVAGWDTALRVGLGSRGPPSAMSVLRGAGGKNGSFGRPGLASAVVVGRWRLCGVRREGEEGRSGVTGAALALARVGRSWTVSVAFAAASGDGGRTGMDVSRFRGRGGMGLDRWVRAGLYDVGRRIWRARLEAGRVVGQQLLRCGATAFWSLTRRHEGLPLSDTFGAISRERVLKKKTRNE